MALATFWAPATAAEPTRAASGSHLNYFQANLDVYGGNSGTPVARAVT